MRRALVLTAVPAFLAAQGIDAAIDAAPLPLVGQRLDGCSTDGGPSSFSVSAENLETGLLRSGVLLTWEALTAALDDPRADIRSLAALELGRDGAVTAHDASWKKAVLSALVRKWDAESDACSKLNTRSALSLLLPVLVYDPAQHPGHQPWIKPFQGCRASAPPLLKLSLEQAPARPGSLEPAVRITVQNLTSETLAFVGAVTEELFSVTVLGPDGEPARAAKGKEWLFEPVAVSHHPRMGNGPLFAPLPPEGAQSWVWQVGEDFDMSEPGTYRVSMGGRLVYLDTTVCSDTADVTVEK